jgi:hypothetical protein
VCPAFAGQSLESRLAAQRGVERATVGSHVKASRWLLIALTVAATQACYRPVWVEIYNNSNGNITLSFESPAETVCTIPSRGLCTFRWDEAINIVTKEQRHVFGKLQDPAAWDDPKFKVLDRGQRPSFRVQFNAGGEILLLKVGSAFPISREQSGETRDFPMGSMNRGPSIQMTIAKIAGPPNNAMNLTRSSRTARRPRRLLQCSTDA